MQEVFSKIIEKLEELKKAEIERDDFCDEEGYGDGEEIYEDGKSAGRYEQTVRIIKIVKQEAEQYNNGWIPCSERLPENNNVVLCWVVSKTIASGETFIIGSCDSGFWFLQTYEIGHHHFPVKDYEVVAWQPLPLPFRDKE